MQLAWPSQAAALLYWAEAVCLWNVAGYVYPGSGAEMPPGISKRVVVIRRVFQAAPLMPLLLLAASPGAGKQARLLFAAASWLLAGTFWAGRDLLKAAVRAKLRLYWVITFPSGYVALSALWIGTAGVSARVTPLVRAGQGAVLLFFFAGLPLLLRGGSEIVRAVLAWAGLDLRAEDGRGHVIGCLERLVFASTIIGGQYAALGFLIAAKGLVRSKDLEDHRFAEYFLIGTLTSIVIAGIVGLALQRAAFAYWNSPS